MKRASIVFVMLLAVSAMIFTASGACFAEDKTLETSGPDLKQRQPIISPPGVPIGPIMPAGRPQQYGVEEIPAGNSPKPCSIKHLLFPWTRESDQ